MIYMFKASPTKYFVTEGQSLEEALIKAFNMKININTGRLRSAVSVGGMEIIECPEYLVSTPEIREVMYGIFA